jgi:hypothetical protein
MAAEVLGVPLEDIICYSSDTDFTPFDKGAYASSTTYISGAAVVKAAEQKLRFDGLEDVTDLPLFSNGRRRALNLQKLTDEENKLLLENSISPLPLHKTLTLETLEEHADPRFAITSGWLRFSRGERHQ